MRKCTPIFGLNGNISKCIFHISHFRHDIMYRHQCVLSDWSRSMQLRCRIFLLREYNFKMCAVFPKRTNTCKLKHLKFFCHFFSRSRKWGNFCDRTGCHNFTKHVGKNVSPMNNYKSIHIQHEICWNIHQYNKETAITRNEYTIFLDSWPKQLKKVLLHGNQGKKILQTFL